MLPLVALVGRPNVGKSTLFNVLTRTRDALVADVPGLTRDRKYGYARVGARRCVVVDTGGLVETVEGVERLMAEQTLKAVHEADRVLFLVDGLIDERVQLSGPHSDPAPIHKALGSLGI